VERASRARRHQERIREIVSADHPTVIGPEVGAESERE
jgi:hypothetical protein